jgi:serine/threonine protein kinase
LPSDEPARRAIPAVIDQYRVFRQIGQGGTGIVCEADDTSLGRRVAIKLIPHEPTFGAARPRCPPEARLAKQVRHPRVVSLYDAGAYSDGVYLVMELVKGRSVQARLDAGPPLGWSEATSIVDAACDGVMAVHASGIIHRDIKPANLLRSKGGAVKVADFSLACWLHPSRKPTDRARFAGTPHYMSPEQCRDDECDERADVYALGATYHTLLTGQTPYADATPPRIMFAHCSAPVPDPRERRREVPRACAQIAMRAMAKKRSDRYESARELQNALRAVLYGRSKAWRN